MRFLEYMPLDGYGNWDRNKLVSGAEILERLRAVGELETIQSDDRSEVAQRFRLSGSQGEIGLILPVTQPFCANCSRLRVTAEGFIKNCLFGQEEWNLRDLLRSGGSDEEVREMIRLAVLKKKAAFGGLTWTTIGPLATCRKLVARSSSITAAPESANGSKRP